MRSALLSRSECKHLPKLSFAPHVSFIVAFCVYKRVLSVREKCDTLRALRECPFVFSVAGMKVADLPPLGVPRPSCSGRLAWGGAHPAFPISSIHSQEGLRVSYSAAIYPAGHRVQARLLFNPANSH